MLNQCHHSPSQHPSSCPLWQAPGKVPQLGVPVQHPDLPGWQSMAFGPATATAVGHFFANTHPVLNLFWCLICHGADPNLLDLVSIGVAIGFYLGLLSINRNQTGSNKVQAIWFVLELFYPQLQPAHQQGRLGYFQLQSPSPTQLR